MSDKTYIKGKDRDLESSIETMLDKLGAIGDVEQALEWVDWCLHVDQLDEERTRQYRCMQALLEIRLNTDMHYDDYADSLALMYGEDNVKSGVGLIEGNELFHGLHSPDLGLDGFIMHNKLLEGYARLHTFKCNNWIKDNRE